MEKINKKVGIFILNYNGLDWIKKNLQNIKTNSPRSKITIIDNDSNDDSINYIKANFPEVSVVKHSKNYGFSKGYNKVLLKNVSEDYFVIMNNDVMVTKKWLDPILELIQKKEIGIIQPKIMNSTKTSLFDYAGAAGGFIDILGIPFCRGRIMNYIEKDVGQYQKNENIFWASGCCFMIERELFQKLNGFDEDFFMHQEEIDLCWRAQSLNKKSYYCAQSTIYHHGGGTLQDGDPLKYYYNHRNNLLLLLKNLSTKYLILVLPIRFIMDYLISIFYFLLGLIFIFLRILSWRQEGDGRMWSAKFKISFLILKAHLSFYSLFLKFLRKRAPVKAKKIYKRSVILDYYLKQKHTFLQLKKF